jgi:hypothetical protein
MPDTRVGIDQDVTAKAGERSHDGKRSHITTSSDAAGISNDCGRINQGDRQQARGLKPFRYSLSGQIVPDRTMKRRTISSVRANAVFDGTQNRQTADNLSR